MSRIIETKTKYDETKDELISVDLIAYDGYFEIDRVEGLDTIERIFTRSEDEAKEWYHRFCDEAYK